jgi:hypothetical protein
MPKAIMIVHSEPSDPAREQEYRSWYDDHIAQALRAVPGLPRARRYRLAADQRHEVSAPTPFMTIYEIEADDIDAVHDRLLAASKDGRLPQSDVIRAGPITYWDLDAEIARERS